MIQYNDSYCKGKQVSSSNFMKKRNRVISMAYNGMLCSFFEITFKGCHQNFQN